MKIKILLIQLNSTFPEDLIFRITLSEQIKKINKVNKTIRIKSTN
jgi:hypothetical protein